MTFWSDSSNTGQGGRGLDDSYPSRVVSFKVSEGMTFIDPAGQRNLSWAKGRAASGHLDVAIGYHVLTNSPVEQQFTNLRHAVGQPSPQFVLMVDVETWSGRMGGNHTAQIEQMLTLARSWLGNRDRAGVYGNHYDLAEMYPHRPAGTWFGEANYGAGLLAFNNDRLWQQFYGGPTGNRVPAGFPTSIAPFGSYIDLNYSPLTSKQLAQRMGVAPTKPVTAAPVQEDTMKYLVHATDRPTDWYVVLGDRWIKCVEAEARVTCDMYGIPWKPKGLPTKRIAMLIAITNRQNGKR